MSFIGPQIAELNMIHDLRCIDPLILPTPILSKDYEQFTGKLFSTVATAGMKIACLDPGLDQELDQNSTTCLCCVCHCMFCGLNFVFAETAPGYLKNF